MKKTAIIALVALAFTNCKKDNNDPEDTIFQANITVDSPEEGDTITGGTSFAVTGTITGNKEMHGYRVQVFKTASSELIFENEHHDHEVSFTISETVTHTLTETTALKVMIEATGDHAGSTVTKDVPVTYIP